MMIIKVKNKEHAFTIPVPYAMLRLGSGILTMDVFQRRMRGWLIKNEAHADRMDDAEPDSVNIGIDLVLSIVENQSTKQAITQLIKALQRCKGTVLVDIRSKDGTEVLIRL
ncbi:hypothetical protein [Paenibacillus sp. CF384]|uniref:hypothetical protein n=1 Tax=Paenibacillus sp. CF384 TaxID=1884382 RepID=UPI00089980E3|nr:hypothetical protein [Paenibacillus sp. CF384]SDW04060.1 hypothetical protein SAMN05518855_100153 [Paenibacillus sp. CF384]